ncbi:MAG TPA: hypothetical protein VKS79_01795 [Gemmataceae bacterium]|nr:hypothetical protein [Gemmataceae bacterium]
MNESEEPEQPWNEAQWEKFLKESEVRSAKFGELLETLMDHPDRDAIIDREMGWDRDDDQSPAMEWMEEALESQEDDDDDDIGNEDPTLVIDDDEEVESSIDADDEKDPFEDRELKKLPYYTRAFDFGLHVHDVLKPYLKPDEEDQDEDFIDALANGFNIAAKLAGAHGMGCEDDMICGNIVCCKRSLEAANHCLRALKSLRDRKLMPAEVANPLLQDGEDVRGLVEQHIADLRSKVWWQ